MKRSCNQCGFTLVEIAIVLFIVGLLTRTLLDPIARAREHKKFDVTRTELQLIKDSLHAHLVSHGFLPCPIPDTGVGVVDDDEVCNVEQGFVPAVKLGLAGAIDTQGALLDAWNRPYRYSVSLSNHSSKGNQRLPDWTSRGEASNVGLRYLSSNLVLCLMPSRGECAKTKVRAGNLAFIVLSLGQDASTSGAQAENQDNDETFVLQAMAVGSNSPFDDQIVWSSTQDVLYWMLRAAWLP